VHGASLVHEERLLVTTLSGNVNLQDVLAGLDFRKGGHLLEPNQFGGLGDVRVTLDRCDSDDL
jgi:hypothetical protein